MQFSYRARYTGGLAGGEKGLIMTDALNLGDETKTGVLTRNDVLLAALEAYLRGDERTAAFLLACITPRTA